MQNEPVQKVVREKVSFRAKVSLRARMTPCKSDSPC